MPDYDLTGLSPRSFEQLIQAIALQEISPQTVIFGDGTDGGREASYRGKTDYSNEAEAEPWDGYIVLQAKFRQIPYNDTGKDGKWAIAQLKKELKDFANPEKKREIPEYYIFITNVILTPVLKDGTKDKAYKLFKDCFENYKDTIPIKSYDIWDYDKIARFLDNYPGIRQTYAAWITPGDVLAKVIQHLEGLNRPDFETVISNFLQKELSSDLNANLEQAGNSKDDRIPLASVFVDLPYANRLILEASQNKKDLFIVAQLIDSAKHKLDPKFLRGNFPINSGISWTEELRKQINSGRWVVIGGPGQGKTTVGQFLCQLFRVAILKDKTNINDPDVLRGISDFKSQCQKETITLPKVRRFPIRIILNDFAAKLASQETNSLLNYIVQRIGKRTNRDIVADDLRLWLATYPWLIILDGLDEVPASSNRKEVLEAIRDFWIDANDVNADIMVVATTRPQGYNEDFGTDSYNHVWLTPLSSEQALHYAGRLVELRYGNNPSRQEKITSRLERAAQDDSTTRLMQSPLQVTIMTLLCDRLGQPPKERWKLFKAYYQVIYQREIERDIRASTLLREYQADIDSIHYQMGLLLQVESERSGKTDARLSVEDFTTLVRSRLLERGHEGQECENLTKQIIEAAANRLVFLVGLEQDIVGFEIRSLQEFMASEAIMNGSDEQIRKRLDEIIPVISWRNVVLFAFGKCFANPDKEHLQESIYTKCSALNENDISFYRASLAGSQLALDLLEDGVLAQQPKYLKLFTRLALNLLDFSPDNFHIQLANIYTESLENIYKEEIEKRVRNQNYQQYLGAWNCLLQLINLGYDWAIELAERYWLQKEEENLEIISAFIKQDNFLKLNEDHWIAQKIILILAKVEPFLVEQKIGWRTIILDFNLLNEITLFFDNLYYKKPNSHFLKGRTKIHLDLDNDFIDDPLTLTYPTLWKLDNIQLDNLNKFLKNHNSLSIWNTYIAIAAFIQNPSELSLFQSLKSIAENDNEQLRQNLSLINIPWQIAECLKFTQNGEELSQIAERAKEGELGNLNDWQQAESRWKTVGITEEDFASFGENNLPYTKNISKFGFPILSSGTSIVVEREPNLYLPIIKKILEIRNNSNYKKLKLRISQIILMTVEICPNIAKEVNFPEIFLAISEVLKNHEESPILDVQFIFSLIRIIGDEYKANVFDLINQYGENGKAGDFSLKDYFEYIKIEQINYIKETIDRFNNNPNNLGLLKIISLVNTSKQEISEALAKVELSLLEPKKYDNPEYQAAAIIVSLYRKTWSNDDIDVIVDYSINLIEEHPRVVARILDLIEVRYFNRDICEKFLCQLNNKIPKSEWQQLNRINRLMNEQLTTRISGLSNKTQWSNLGLPQGASSLLPE